MLRTLNALLVSVLLASGPQAAAVGSALDPTFSRDGKVVLDFGDREGSARDVAILPSGKVLVASAVTTTATSAFGVSRLRADGTPDPTFNGRGRVVTDLGGGSVPRRVVPLGRGRVLVAGSAELRWGAGGGFALAVYTRDGSLDRSFGYRGTVTTELTPGLDAVLDVQVQDDGGLLAAGFAGNQFAWVRYTAAGAVDPSFGTDGIVMTTDGFAGQAYTARLQPDGKLLVAGTSQPDANSVQGLEVARFDTDGSLDPSFGGGDGRVSTFPPDREVTRGFAVAVQPDGRILVGGRAFGEGDYGYFCLARYLADGTPDPSFGDPHDGPGVAVDSGDQYYAATLSLALQGDGRIVAAGWTDRSSAPNSVAVLRYTAAGVLDATFGGGDGRVTIGFGRKSTEAQAVAVGGGRIVVAGDGSGRQGRLWAVVARLRG